MQKIKIRLPATISNLGPGLGAFALALGLYVTVEVSPRVDTGFNVVIAGEGHDAYPTPLHHPVVQVMSRFFQRLERAPLGVDIHIINQIPLNAGLGAQTAFAVAGVLAANDLMNTHYRRPELLRIAAHAHRNHAANVVAALLGGIGVGLLQPDGELVYRTLPAVRLSVILVQPYLDDYRPPVLPEYLPREDMLDVMNRLPLLLEALRSGDLKLIAGLLDDAVLKPQIVSQITGYGHVVEMARRSGALAVTPCGAGPAVLALAPESHSQERIAEDMVLAFKSAGVQARSWVVPVDTQGVVISAVQSV